MKYFLICFFSFLALSAQALEIDEKLTVRVVKVSDSRKTILINRGQEDGISKGDHAKFYLSVGVVARGVAIKISPTRSVWSLYRLVNADYIKDDQVMKLKGTAPVKITKDESRALVDDDTASMTTTDPRDLGIPLAAGAEDLSGGEFGAGKTQIIQAPSLLESDLGDRNKEIFGGFSYESLSSKTSADNSNLDNAGTDSYMSLDAGFEYYFKDQSKWYSRISLVGMFRLTNLSVTAYEGSEIQSSISYFGGGVGFYPFTRPDRTYKLIPFGQVMYYMGSVDSSAVAQSGSPFSLELSGAVTMVTIGGGVKYFIHNGWGINAKLEYVSRLDDYSQDTNSVKWQKSASGPRFVTGIGYRF